MIGGCPSDITMHVIDSGKTAIVSWTEPIASDNVGVAQFTLNFNSGGIFSVGETIVIYQAQDGADNSASCVFAVVLAVPTGKGSTVKQI